MKLVSTYHVGNSQIYGKTKNVSGTQLEKSETVMVLQNNVAWWFWVFESGGNVTISCCYGFIAALYWKHTLLLWKWLLEKTARSPVITPEEIISRLISEWLLILIWPHLTWGKKESGKRQRLQNHRMMTGQETKMLIKFVVELISSLMLHCQVMTLCCMRSFFYNPHRSHV